MVGQERSGINPMPSHIGQERSGINNSPISEHEGDKFLSMLGLENIADKTFIGRDGERRQMREFLEVCGNHARPMLLGLEALGVDDPNYFENRAKLQSMILGFVESSHQGN